MDKKGKWAGKRMIEKDVESNPKGLIQTAKFYIVTVLNL